MRSPTPSRCSSSWRRWRLAVRTIASISCARTISGSWASSPSTGTTACERLPTKPTSSTPCASRLSNARASRAASSPAPRPSTRRGLSVVRVRCWRTSQPAIARKPKREAATSRRGSAPVSRRAAAAMTSAVTSVAPWAWRTSRTARARWYSPRSRRKAEPTSQATAVAATASARPMAEAPNANPQATNATDASTSCAARSRPTASERVGTVSGYLTVPAFATRGVTAITGFQCFWGVISTPV